MEASMSTVPTNLSSVTPKGICTKGHPSLPQGSRPGPAFPSAHPGRQMMLSSKCRHQSVASALTRPVLALLQGFVGSGKVQEDVSCVSVCMYAAYLPFPAVFWISIAVAPLDDLDWRQESMQASRKHRLQTRKTLQHRHPCSACENTFCQLNPFGGRSGRIA